MPGNWRPRSNDAGPRRLSRPPDAHPVSQLRRRRCGRKHLQQQSAAAGRLCQRHPNITVDVGQVLFGETTSMTGDGPLGYYLSNVYKSKWFSADTEMEAGCGIAPIKYRNKTLSTPAMGDRPGVVLAGERSLARGDEHRPSQRRQFSRLSADHSAADGSRLSRRECSNRAIRKCASAPCSATYDARIHAERNRIITRAGPARMLGLKHKGHLGPGADADITLYTPHENKQRCSKCRVRDQSGRDSSSTTAKSAVPPSAALCTSAPPTTTPPMPTSEPGSTILQHPLSELSPKALHEG
jgi:hypothetical protein